MLGSVQDEDKETEEVSTVAVLDRTAGDIFLGALAELPLHDSQVRVQALICSKI